MRIKIINSIAKLAGKSIFMVCNFIASILVPEFLNFKILNLNSKLSILK